MSINGLRIETGHWGKTNNHRTPREERVCLSCFKQGFIEVESEEHFLLRCRHPALKSYRENLLCKACTILPTFNSLNDTDKLFFLFSNCDIIFLVPKSVAKCRFHVIF